LFSIFDIIGEFSKRSLKLIIGFPRALIYYYYYPMWKSFFEELGFETVVSEQTNKFLLNEGVKASVPEICVPIKIYNGHILSLLNKEADLIFVPRMVSIKKNEVFCPKFMGLPDIMTNSIPGMKEKILTFDLSLKNENIGFSKGFLELSDRLAISEDKIKKALKLSALYWEDFRKICQKGNTVLEALDALEKGKKPQELKRRELPEGMKIGLLGYVYNIYDNFVSMDITQKLRERNVSFYTFEMFDDREIRRYISNMRKTLFWSFSNKLLGLGNRFVRKRDVDGIIHITAFGCGPDAFWGNC